MGELCYLDGGVGTFPNECKPKNRPCSFHPGASPDICQKTTHLFRSVDTPPPPACDPDCADVEPSTYGPHSVPAWERHDPPRQGTSDQQGTPDFPMPHTCRYAVENGLCDGLGGVPSADRSAAQKDFMTSGFCAKTCGFCIPCTRERSFDDIVCTDGRLNVNRAPVNVVLHSGFCIPCTWEMTSKVHLGDDIVCIDGCSHSPALAVASSGTIPTSVTCDTGAGCGLCLQLISPSDCPEDLDSLRRCDDASVGFGDLCVGDGACGTNPAARNCGHAVYRNVDVCVCDDLEPEVNGAYRNGEKCVCAVAIDDLCLCDDIEVIAGRHHYAGALGICSAALEQSKCPDLVRRGYRRASCSACKPRTPRSPPAPAEEEAEEEAEEVEEGASQYRLQYRLSDGDTGAADVALATGAVRCCETSPCIAPMCRAPIKLECRSKVCEQRTAASYFAAIAMCAGGDDDDDDVEERRLCTKAEHITECGGTPAADSMRSTCGPPTSARCRRRRRRRRRRPRRRRNRRCRRRLHPRPRAASGSPTSTLSALTATYLRGPLPESNTSTGNARVE